MFGDDLSRSEEWLAGRLAALAAVGVVSDIVFFLGPGFLPRFRGIPAAVTDDGKLDGLGSSVFELSTSTLLDVSETIYKKKFDFNQHNFFVRIINYLHRTL